MAKLLLFVGFPSVALYVLYQYVTYNDDGIEYFRVTRRLRRFYRILALLFVTGILLFLLIPLNNGETTMLSGYGIITSFLILEYVFIRHYGIRCMEYGYYIQEWFLTGKKPGRDDPFEQVESEF